MHSNHAVRHATVIIAILAGVVACSPKPANVATDSALSQDLKTAQMSGSLDTVTRVEGRASSAPRYRTETRRTSVVRHSGTPSQSSIGTSGSNSSNNQTTTVARDPGTHDVKNTNRDAAVGAGAGAVLGAITSKNKVRGGVIGGILGGVAGAVVGNNVDKKRVPNRP